MFDYDNPSGINYTVISKSTTVRGNIKTADPIKVSGRVIGDIDCEKRAAVTEAEGQKQSAILVAEGEKESTILRAEARKEARIREAEGEAEAILSVQRAMADSLRLLNEASPSDRVIALKSLEAFQKAADGKATKIIIPSEIQSLAGLATSVKELFSDGGSASR